MFVIRNKAGEYVNGWCDDYTTILEGAYKWEREEDAFDAIEEEDEYVEEIKE